MFTGIVVARGFVVRKPAPSGRGGVSLFVGHPASLVRRLPVGASLAVNGVCLTVAARDDADGRAVSRFELSAETLARTNLGALEGGNEVNLEPALALGEALGGHWVQGHVDATLVLLAREDDADHSVFTFELPEAHARYVIEKGSVCLDGVSLTVAERDRDRFTVALVPHTLAVTTLGELRPGARVNFEADVLAKYVEGLLAGRSR